MKAFNDHVLAVYPNEAVGLIKSGEIHIVDNISETPETSFKVDPLDVKKIKPTGMIHSHPYDPLEYNKLRNDRRTPSKADMQTMEVNDKDFGFGIVCCCGGYVSEPLWIDDVEEELNGRKFISGKNDQYSVVRDYFYYHHDKKIKLPLFPRNFGWWTELGMEDTVADLLMDDFEEIDKRDIDVGDIVLFKMKNDFHMAVYSKPDNILHHMFTQLSVVESYYHKMEYTYKVLRIK